MNSTPEPRLNKLPFYFADAACLLAVLLIGLYAKDPFAPLPFVSAVLLVILGGVALLIPYLADYAADTRETSARLREELELQSKRAQAAGEILTRASAHLKAIEEAVHKSARDAETLPYRMQEKLAEFNEALAAKESDDREALEQELEELRAANSSQLKAVAEKIGKAAADWTALEVATRQQITGAEVALAKLHSGTGDALAANTARLEEAATTVTTRLEAALAGSLQQFDRRLAAALAQLAAKVGELEQAIAAVPVPIPAGNPPPAPLPQPPVPVVPSAPEEVVAPAVALPAEAAAIPAVDSAPTTPVPTTEASAPAVESAAPAVATEPAAPTLEEMPKPRKPRAPRKPKAEDILAAMSEAPAVAASAEPAVSPAPEPAAPEPAPAAAASAPAEEASSDESGDDTRVEASASSDGATRLLATAYIGIGNKLFIRGDGPGLSWDHGVPMQFVSIGKWGWFTHEAGGPVRIKLYKNDEHAALSGEVTLEPGRHTEVTALF